LAGVRAVRDELVALITQARATQGMDQKALAGRLGWRVSRVHQIEDPEEIEALGFDDLLDLIEAVGLDAGEVTDWLAVRYRAEHRHEKEENL
jgi:hypothetical protein